MFPRKLSSEDLEHAIDRSAEQQPPAAELDESSYFAQNAPPPYLDQVRAQTEAFVAAHARAGRRVALVTSGGTTVPLENQTVRFIDNFSAGTRGATSAEYFIERGYAVIFVHRQFSLLPYSRHYSHSTNCFLDYMTEADGSVVVDPQYQEQMRGVLRKYRQAKRDNMLLLVPFTTISQYLHTLRTVSVALQTLESSALLYLAAAVSDFFVPPSRVPEHKIQSQAGGQKLVIDLDPVPKFLKRLVERWAPTAMIVSFKLETDPSILIAKATGALERYQHQLVIGNLLQTRSREVVLVSLNPPAEAWLQLTPEQAADGVEIESLLVPAVVALHETYLARA
ncbi:DNA/pantothenate metabolism flavoprotein [Dipodascopsis tothii]|uniref:DNA/pantothenate metabolism flavoprotein n=1 Tax=Dipodascopsis tothii TaxID=44089 RepID=UPI0034CEC095